MTSSTHLKRSGIEYPTDLSPSDAAMLTGDALDLIGTLCDEFAPRIRELASRDETARRGGGTGRHPELPVGTTLSGDGDWQIADVPAIFRTGRLELVAPPERAAIEAALASAADYCIVNFADALAPAPSGAFSAHTALHESLLGPGAVSDHGPVLLRPRPLLASEPGLLWHGKPVPAAVVDTCLYIVHNATLLEQHGSGIYLELAHLASQDEARLWRDLIGRMESAGRAANGTVRAAIRVDTVAGAFAIDDILRELRDYAVGLHTDFIAYAASFIRTFQHFPAFMLPDRAELTFTAPFLSALAMHVVRTGQRRGVPTSAPAVRQRISQGDPEASARSMQLARRYLSWYRQHGFDRLRVMDPELVKLAAEVHDTVHASPDTRHDRVRVTADDLLHTPRGKITRDGIRDNLRLLLRYLPALRKGHGTVAASGELHDADSARLALAQLWQWARHATGVLDEGRNIDTAMIRVLLDDEPGDSVAKADLMQLIGSDALPAGF